MIDYEKKTRGRGHLEDEFQPRHDDGPTRPAEEKPERMALI